MDNGQSAWNNGTQPFFTTGAGTNFENKNDFEAENNLNSDNQTASWDVSPDRNPRAVGNTAIFSSETTPEEVTKQTPYERVKNLQENPFVSSPENYFNQAPNLGEIIDIEKPGMPPGTVEDPTTKTTAGEISQMVHENEIRTTNTLSRQAVEEIDRCMSELSRDLDIAKFNDRIRDLNKINVKNSFGVEF